MRTKRVFITVCRQWFRVGTPIFYEEVALYHMSQLSGLIQTVDAPNFIGSLIKRIDGKCGVLPDELCVFESQLQHLFDQCPNVTRICCDTIPYPEPLEWTMHCTFQYHSTSEHISEVDAVRVWRKRGFCYLVKALQQCHSLESSTCQLRNTSDRPLTSEVYLPHQSFLLH